MIYIHIAILVIGIEKREKNTTTERDVINFLSLNKLHVIQCYVSYRCTRNDCVCLNEFGLNNKISFSPPPDIRDGLTLAFGAVIFDFDFKSISLSRREHECLPRRPPCDRVNGDDDDDGMNITLNFVYVSLANKIF